MKHFEEGATATLYEALLVWPRASAHCLARESAVHPVTHLGPAAAMAAATVMAVDVELGLARGAAGSRHVL